MAEQEGIALTRRSSYMPQIPHWRPEIHNGQDLTSAYGSSDRTVV